MEEIVCECGHSIIEHGFLMCKRFERYTDESGNKIFSCNCRLSRDIVQARYFAKYFYKKYNSTDKIRANLLEQYWALAGKYIQVEHDRKDLEEKLIKSMEIGIKTG